MLLINIYQLPIENPNIFRNKITELSNYDLVYSCKRQDNTTLDDIFTEFNIAHPNDYQARSLSVSDIVQINDCFYFCKSCGWEKYGI